jgi:dihydrodipicolinate synthase/N-acetylneuraminate lyase
VTTVHGIAGLKAAMDLVGLRGGSVRSPLLPAADSASDEIRPLLERAESAV